ncbi:MAG: hypothetical protein JXR78_02635 [Victivallales bacterium]|nr:hypothetical protein [Victivallales bacterium]
MKLRIIDGGMPRELEPLTCSFKVQDIPVAGKTIGNRLEEMFAELESDLVLSIFPCLYPSAELVGRIAASGQCVVEDVSGNVLAQTLTIDGKTSDKTEKITVDGDSVIVRYPWDILRICELIVGALDADHIEGTIREHVVIDGKVRLGKNSVLLPGVYIEGNVIIGENCKIGPNCYIRGNTFIGDGCHVGQAVEVKNSMLMDKVAAGHLSYIGDSIVCPRTNFGAGTIISNFRHDGKNHHSMINGELVDTGRRKFGSIIGENVHTGVHTSIYCGRKIWKDACTLPGAVINKDLRPEK